MTHSPRILRLDKAGYPIGWLSKETATILYAKGQIIWSLGDETIIMRGGYSRLGIQTKIELPSIIACEGDIVSRNKKPPLCNRLLFRRDQYICMYCGDSFAHADLSRDHIVPKIQGGKDLWTNVVTACRRCNQRKGGRTPEQASMELLAVPFEPNPFEYLYLSNHHIMSDQMAFLGAKFSKNLRLQ